MDNDQTAANWQPDPAKTAQSNPPHVDTPKRRGDAADQLYNSHNATHNGTRLLPTPRNVNASSQRTSLHYLVALSTTNTRGDCMICTSRELPTTADRARTATLYRGSRPSPEHYVTCARRQRPTSLPCFGRSTSHLEVLGQWARSKNVFTNTPNANTALVGLRTFWLLFHSSFYTNMWKEPYHL